MATGLSIPVRVSAAGRLAIATGSEQDENIITMALASTENQNAFQQNEDVGLPAIFDINDGITQAGVIARVRRVFARFERLKRFKLLEDTIEFRETAGGESVLYFKYAALEADVVRDHTQRFTASNAAATIKT